MVLVLKAGIGGPLAIATLAWLSHVTRNSWLMAPFGANCVLLFSVPGRPLSQPASVIGGHIVSMAIGLALRALLLMEWWSMGLAIAIAAMAALRVTHPPAGTDPPEVVLDNP